MVHSWEAWVFCIVLSVLVPFHGVLAYHRLASAPEPIPTRRKLRLYATIVVLQWTLVGAAYAIAHSHGLEMRHIGQTLAYAPLTLAVIALGLVALLALARFNVRQIKNATREELEATVERARKLVPAGRVQIVGFAFVALTAGICEEILYRGWLVNFLGAAFGSIWVGVIAASVLFGVGHAYQGVQGMLATGSLGLVFGSMYVWVRSLVPAQVLHAGIDLVNGVLGGRIVERLGPAPPEAGAEAPPSQGGEAAAQAGTEPPTSA